VKHGVAALVMLGVTALVNDELLKGFQRKGER